MWDGVPVDATGRRADPLEGTRAVRLSEWSDGKNPKAGLAYLDKLISPAPVKPAAEKAAEAAHE